MTTALLRPFGCNKAVFYFTENNPLQEPIAQFLEKLTYFCFAFEQALFGVEYEKFLTNDI